MSSDKIIIGEHLSLKKYTHFEQQKFLSQKRIILLWLLLSHLLVISLAFSTECFGQMNSLNEYVVGWGGRDDCFPPPDLSACTDEVRTFQEWQQLVTNWSKAPEDLLDYSKRALVKIRKECELANTDPGNWEKFAILALIMTSGPVGFWIAGGFATSELLEEDMKCFMKGLIEASSKSRKEKNLWRSRLDTIFEIKDMDEWIKKISNFKSFMQTKDLEALQGLFESIASAEARGKGASYLFNYISDGILDFLESPAKQALRKAKTDMENCDFYRANDKLSKANKYTWTYCEIQGRKWRALEKIIRCHQEKYYEVIEEQRREYFTQEHATQRVGPQLRQLDQWEIELDNKTKTILSSLRLFEDIHKTRNSLKLKNKKFHKKRSAYDDARDKVEDALKYDNDLKTACKNIMEMLRLLKNENNECKAALQKYYADKPLTHLISLLNQKAQANYQRTRDLLQKVDSALLANQTKNARAALNDAQNYIENLMVFENGACITPHNLVPLIELKCEYESWFLENAISAPHTTTGTKLSHECARWQKTCKAWKNNWNKWNDIYDNKKPDNLQRNTILRMNNYAYHYNANCPKNCPGYGKLSIKPLPKP